METLRKFWKFFDGESPDHENAISLGRRNMSELAWESLTWAANMIARRRGEKPFEDAAEDIQWALGHNSWALRELSLSVCESLGKMYERVDAGPVPESGRSGEHVLRLEDIAAQTFIGNTLWVESESGNEIVWHEDNTPTPLSQCLTEALERSERMRTEHRQRLELLYSGEEPAEP